MVSLSSLLRSLLLASFFSFLAPVLFLGGAYLGLTLLGYVPLLQGLSHTCLEQLTTVLGVFGSGSFAKGVCVIGVVCSLVGALFDTYTFIAIKN